jgi:hypothetical protein
MTSRASRPLSLTVPPEIFRFIDVGADVISGHVGVELGFRPLEHAQEALLVAKQSPEQPVERGVAGLGAFEDAVEAGAGFRLAPGWAGACIPSRRHRAARSSAWRPRWHCTACRWRGPACGRGARREPSTAVHADAEYDGVRQQALMADGSAQRTLGGDQDRIGK